MLLLSCHSLFFWVFEIHMKYWIVLHCTASLKLVSLYYYYYYYYLYYYFIFIIAGSVKLLSQFVQFCYLTLYWIWKMVILHISKMVLCQTYAWFKSKTDMLIMMYVWILITNTISWTWMINFHHFYLPCFSIVLQLSPLFWFSFIIIL